MEIQFETSPVGTSVAAAGAGVRDRDNAGFRLLAGLRSDCWSSQRRKVSRPISMPSNRKPPTSDSTESPAWRSRSNSSRWTSSCAVAWLRGCRDWATAWASVVGGGGFDKECMGNDWVSNEARYADRTRIARGAPEAHSKRKRLDVGVSSYAFVFILVDDFGSFIGFLLHWLIRWLVSLSLYWGSFVEWLLNCSWVESLGLVAWVRSLNGILSGSVRHYWAELRMFTGGGGC